jgi:hypothetical protein
MIIDKIISEKAKAHVAPRGVTRYDKQQFSESLNDHNFINKYPPDLKLVVHCVNLYLDGHNLERTEKLLNLVLL